jgi:hypothetical protein
MRRIFALGLLLVGGCAHSPQPTIGTSAPDTVQRVFNGTWRPDLALFDQTRQVNTIELVNGVYACRTCRPPHEFTADGQDQPVRDNSYYDTMSVTTVDDRTIAQIAKKGGKVIAASTIFVSADDMTLTEVQTDYDTAPRPIEYTIRLSRVSSGPQGSHLVSGTWRNTSTEVSNHAGDTTFKIAGKTLAISSGKEESLTADLGGNDAPYYGGGPITTVSFKVVDNHTIEQTSKHNGEVVWIDRWSVDPDGKTMHVHTVTGPGHSPDRTLRKVE